MTNREVKYTEIADYRIRQTLWEEAVTATRKHIQLAQAFQGAGADIIKQLQRASQEPNADPEQLTKYHQQCLANIEKGVKIEREARQELQRLHTVKPKEK